MNNTNFKSRSFFVLLAVYCLLIVLTLAFIFGNSMVSKAESTAQSDQYIPILKPTLDPNDNLSSDEFSAITRKLAHFVEFGLLGLELALLAFHISGGFKPRDSVYAAFGGLLCANTDELIQAFYERGSLVSDVFLDFGGVVLGIAVGYLLAYAARAIYKRISARKSINSAEQLHT